MFFTPIIDKDHPLQLYFPDREIGLLITTFGSYMLMSVLCVFTGIILLKDEAYLTDPKFFDEAKNIDSNKF